MKKISLFIVLSLFLTTLINPSSLSATSRGIRVTAKEGQSLYLYKDYYALVVGISNYERWPQLPNAGKDAKEVAARLKELGFHVKTVVDPTSRELKTVLNEMVYTMGGEENRAILFYYAGHGETETLADKTKMGYIIPKDCPLLAKNPMGFATHAISMRDIESASMRIKSKHVVMVFDSCFSGSLFALVRAVPHDITEKSTLPVRQYITAGREDEQVPDKSMFKRCFLVGLEGDADLTGDGYITGSELGMYLSDKVVNYTHRRQHPQYGKINNPDLDRGDFIFALKVPEKEEEIDAVAIPQPPKKAKKPKSGLDEFLGKIKEKEKDKKRAHDLLVQNFKQLLDDCEKYKKIKNSDLDSETKLAAWKVLSNSYPQWSDGVEPGDSGALVSRALASDSDGTLAKLTERKKGFDTDVRADILKSAPSLKLAILPWYKREVYGDMEKLLHAIVGATGKYKNIKLQYSYYKHKDLEELHDVEFIDGIIDKHAKKRIWHRKSTFSSMEPNLDFISEFAEKIGADLVLIYSYGWDASTEIASRGINTQYGYVIDVKNKKIYSDHQTFSIANCHSGYEDMTKTLYGLYLRNTASEEKNIPSHN